MASLAKRMSNAWNAFMNKDPTYIPAGRSSTVIPYRSSSAKKIDKSIATAVCNRIAMDAAQIDIKHVILDDDNRYIADVDSELNDILTLEANIDQTSRSFKQDLVMSLLEEGHAVIVPTVVDDKTGTIYEVRIGKVTKWYPRDVRVELYNDIEGSKTELTFDKSEVCIIENPMYAVMNEHNSTMQRLIRKLNLLDIIDEQSSGKLDMVIQLPYQVRSDARKVQAEARRSDIEEQLVNNKYGIAYIDSTEKITQLNRPIENGLQAQIEYLTELLFSQLGITKSILDCTADDKTMNNYYNRTIEPIMTAIVLELRRKFLTKTARTRKQSVMFFRDHFSLVPVSVVAEMADKFTRNEIMTSNEIRQKMGMRPSSDPKADQLVNSNIAQPAEQGMYPPEEIPPEGYEEYPPEEGYEEYPPYEDGSEAPY